MQCAHGDVVYILHTAYSVCIVCIAYIVHIVQNVCDVTMYALNTLNTMCVYIWQCPINLVLKISRKLDILHGGWKKCAYLRVLASGEQVWPGFFQF